MSTIAKIEYLRLLIARITALKAERDIIIKQGKDLEDEISAGVHHGDYLKDADVEKLSKAQVKKQMVPGRLKSLDIELGLLQRGTQQAWKDAARKLDNYVQIKREEKFQEFLNAIEPFMGGKEKARLTRREFENTHVPARDDFRRFFSQDFFDASGTDDTYLEFAKHFIAHCERVLKETGWKEEDIESAPRFKDVGAYQPAALAPGSQDESDREHKRYQEMNRHLLQQAVDAAKPKRSGMLW